MEATLARSLFKRLGGKIAQSVRHPGRELWVLCKPKAHSELAPGVAARDKNTWKTFRMARDLMVSMPRGYSQRARA